jgi:hypothetical protein
MYLARVPEHIEIQAPAQLERLEVQPFEFEGELEITTNQNGSTISLTALLSLSITTIR